MKVSIIPSDQMVSVDGETIIGVDLVFMNPAINAVQWYGESGEVEVKSPDTGKMLINIQIQDFAPYQQAVTNWQTRKNAIKAENDLRAQEAAMLKQQSAEGASKTA
jgi:hypothetical protein